MDDDTPSNVLPFVPQAPTKKRRGQTPERMRELTRIRQEKIARGELNANGHKIKGSGAGRLKPLTDKEVRERALQTAADLFDDARQTAVNKLIEQIDHKDPGIAQKAATKVLEYTDGKPNQPVTARTENVTKVVYETAALPPDVFVPGFGLDDDEEMTG